MNTDRLRTLYDEFLEPEMRGFVLRERLMYETPLENLLRGYRFERARSEHVMRIVMFVHPLYVPARDVTFSFSRHFHDPKGRARAWTLRAGLESDVMEEVLECMRTQGEPFLRELQTPADLAAHAHKLFMTDLPPYARTQSPHLPEAVAYSHVLAGNLPAAEQELDRLDEILEQSYQPWKREIAGRAAEVRTALANSEGAARELLRGWRDRSARELGLE